MKLIQLTTILFLSFLTYSQSNGFEVVKNLELIDQVYEHLDKYYVDEPKAGKMAVAGIDAMLHELDPYTVFYPETEIEDFRLMTTGQYGGIGSLIRKINDYTFIAEPYENSPAAKAGLKAGDKILRINDKDMHNKSTEEVSSALKGPKGTTVEVAVEREKGKTQKISITREEIKLPDVPYSGIIEDKTGYIKLNSFTQTAHKSVSSAFSDLKSEGMEKLVLDLRGNGGGLLIEAVKIVNMFVEKGQTIVNTKGRVVEENRTYKTLNEPVDLEIPLVILINGSSASASEIVAGSLQDLDRAVIIGETSFGKGLVQRTYDLKYGSKIKLTIAKYYTPSGRCVQRLDYYEKQGEIPEEVPDSLIRIFHTVNGREVIDGRGIEPDIPVEQNDLSRLTATIYGNNHIFNYASTFTNENAKIDEPGKFSITEAQYVKFKDYVLQQDFTYSTASEEMLKRMKETAKEEGFYKDSEEEFDALMQKVVPSKERDLEKFKDEIKMMLENEIISRYYYQKGRAVQSFKYDAIFQKSKEILKDMENYNTILGN